MLLLDDRFLVLPLHAKRRVGEQVVELLALETVACLAVAQRVAKHDAARVLVLYEHVRAADSPGLVIVLLPEEGEVGLTILIKDEFLGLR